MGEIINTLRIVSGQLLVGGHPSCRFTLQIQLGWGGGVGHPSLFLFQFQLSAVSCQLFRWVLCLPAY